MLKIPCGGHLFLVLLHFIDKFYNSCGVRFYIPLPILYPPPLFKWVKVSFKLKRKRLHGKFVEFKPFVKIKPAFSKSESV